MQKHILQLAAESFHAVKTNEKTIESRLFDEKRQKISLGDQIEFINRETPEEKVLVLVTGILRYPTFKELFRNNDVNTFGGISVEWLLAQIYEFYSHEEEKQYGVVGIEFKKI